MKRRNNKLLCSVVALFSSSACPSSTIIIGVVSGELQPSPHRRVTSLAFFPRENRVKYHKKRRKSHELTPIITSNDVLQLRCGGADESNFDGEDILAENNIDGSSSQPVVDISIVENEDLSFAKEGDDVDTDVSAAAEVGLESDASEEEDSSADVSNEIDDESDLLESDESQDGIDTSEDGLNGEEQAEAEDTESSDESDVTGSPIASEDDTPDNTELMETQSNLLSSASDRRAEGKTFHDAGDLSDAATAFGEAASLLDEAIAITAEMPTEDMEDNSIAVERATCRLHEALCLLKDGRPGDSVEACTDVLEDGVTVVLLDGEDEDNDAESSGETEEDGSGERKPTAVVKIVPTTNTPHSAYRQKIPPQIRARAHHRRAKARLALGDLDGALEDARSAAFMGDRNAVQFYGRLMREGSGAAETGGESMLSPGGFGASPFGLTGDGSAGGGASNAFLEGMLGGMGGSNNNPLIPSGAGSNGDFSSSLLSSLLSSGANDGGGGGNPLGLMGELLAPQDNSKGGKHRRGKKKGGGGMDTLAKSVISNLMKRIEDEDTQETICNYLQSTNTQQIMQFAAMGGIPMKEENAQRLAKFAGGVTPKGISKSISKVKRGISIVKTVRKVLKVIDKYKAYIILAVLVYWIRSAILEPYPVSKKKAKKLAQQAALSLLIMPTASSGQRSGIRSLGNVCGGMVKALSGLYMSGGDNVDGEKGGTSQNGIEDELERLQNQLTLIEAIEERNKAQLESFVDEVDQWESLEEDEREMLSSKDSVVKQMEDLAEQLVMLFMGQKMKNG